MEAKGRILLHTCCGVCASHCVRVLKEDGWTPVLFFSNFNIAPHAEYLRRRAAAIRLAEAEGVEWVEDRPDHAQWVREVAEGYETCKEGGARCERCFRFSLNRAFKALGATHCQAFTTSLTVSPHKPSPLLLSLGQTIGGETFQPYNFKKQDGFLDSNRRAAELGLYRQMTCGCEFSQRHREPFKVAVLGMGYRGRIYARWALAHPADLQIVSIAEPNDKLRTVWGRALGAAAFRNWRDALEVEGLEGVILALPDRLHHDATLSALQRRLHVLLEKPIGATWDECVAVDDTVRASERCVEVGHILRFTPYYQKIKELIREGSLGKVVSIQHLEPVGYQKAAHVFCRGPWGHTTETTPMILQKCSHDFDLFAWWVGAPCTMVQSFGSLLHFRPEHAPNGAAKRCLECPAAIERNCPYSAKRLLLEERLLWYALPETSPEALQALLESHYGNCVYTCGSDAVDHQIVNLRFANGVTVSHCMESYTLGRDRQTRIFLTNGEIIGDARHLTIHRFSDRSTTLWDAALEAGNALHESSYILGNDGLLRDWVDTLRTLPPAYYFDRFHESIQAHAMAFAAEASRVRDGIAVPLAAL